MPEPTKAHLVANARYHDTDYARLRLLELLAEDQDIRTTVASTFGETETLAQSDVLLTYTCDLRPSPDEERSLHDFVAGGGRWIALHATNALLDFGPDGVRCSREYDTFMETMGSRFVAHPMIEPYEVRVSDPTHPLVAGIEPLRGQRRALPLRVPRRDPPATGDQLHRHVPLRLRGERVAERRAQARGLHPPGR